jgi:N-hydroxyarylamine O-acetyltransferase
VDSYLSRLNYLGSLSPTYETLRGLQLAHMRSVPFENLDIVPLHRPITLGQAALWEKIVVRKRGGFCYELNGLFSWLLDQLGFLVTHLNARVFTRAGRLGIDFDHLALLVSAPGEHDRWLADVGFGDSFLEPLVLRDGEQPQGSHAYRLEQDPAGYVVWRKKPAAEWERLYFFDLTPHSFPAEYEAACSYHQRSPESSFTRSPVISRATEDGRISLERDRLILTINGERSESPVRSEEWSRVLAERFGVVL